jgi:hypothetical protein
MYPVIAGRVVVRRLGTSSSAAASLFHCGRRIEANERSTAAYLAHACGTVQTALSKKRILPNR